MDAKKAKILKKKLEKDITRLVAEYDQNTSCFIKVLNLLRDNKTGEQELNINIGESWNDYWI